MEKAAYRGCKVLLEVCAEAKPGEKILILTDDQSLEIGMTMYEYARREYDATLVCMKPRTTHGEAATACIEAAMQEADVIFGATTFSVYNTGARISACEKGARFVNMCDYSMKMLEEGCLFADFKGMKDRLDEMAKRIVGKEIHVTTPAGTDLWTSIEGRHADIGYGRSVNPGEASSPPDVECAVGPADNSATGILVVDGSIPMPGVGLIREPIRIRFEAGKIVSIEGGEQAKILEETLRSYNDDRVFLAAEVGFGMNPAASLSGRMLEDEGTYGTMHIGIGNNLSYGGHCDTPVHIDLIMKKGTAFVDGVCVMRDGEIVE